MIWSKVGNKIRGKLWFTGMLKTQNFKNNNKNQQKHPQMFFIKYRHWGLSYVYAILQRSSQCNKPAMEELICGL